MKEYAPTLAVLLDIDGTLLDSNHAHALSWIEIFTRHGHALPYERVRAQVGKGSDKLLQALLGLQPGDPLAERIVNERRQLFLDRFLPGLAPTPGARALLHRLKADGLQLVVATASGSQELQALLEQAGVADLLPCRTTGSDVSRSKPDPDTVAVALKQAGVDPIEAIMLGDTPYDIVAARAAGVDTIAMRCGGWWDDRALDGAVALYDHPEQLLAQFEQSPIFRRRIPAG